MDYYELLYNGQYDELVHAALPVLEKNRDARCD
jgi:hypothetical protein